MRHKSIVIVVFAIIISAVGYYFLNKARIYGGCARDLFSHYDNMTESELARDPEAASLMLQGMTANEARAALTDNKTQAFCSFVDGDKNNSNR